MIQRHAQLLITAKADHSKLWRGEISPLEARTTLFDTESEDQAEEAGESKERSSSAVLLTEKDRTLFSDSLKQAIPVFSAPLYIGSTKSLKRRISEHLDDLREGSQYLASGTGLGKGAALLRVKNCFGYRAAIRELNEDSLRVTILPVLDKTLSFEQRLSHARALERILNQTYAPVLGKM